MDAVDLSYALVAALEDGDIELLDGADDKHEVSSARVFADANLITSDQGLVLTLEGGETFQITIVPVRS